MFFGKLLDIELTSRESENATGNPNLAIVPCILCKTIGIHVGSEQKEPVVNNLFNIVELVDS